MNSVLSVEVPAENHLTFPLLVEKRMVNAISTLLYIRENELQDVIVSSQSVNIVDGQREDDYWLNENDTGEKFLIVPFLEYQSPGSTIKLSRHINV